MSQHEYAEHRHSAERLMLASDGEDREWTTETTADMCLWPGDNASHTPINHTVLHSGMMLGQYEVIRKLGTGGMGTVYLARDIRLGRRVAIKFQTKRNLVQARRFQAEARATARCKHDNIVDIYDVGEAGGHAFMVLEYIDGITLSAWLKQRSRAPEVAKQDTASTVSDCSVSPVLAIELIAPVIRALAHAHKLGLVHRDLKPSNIMLADDGSIKVLDFGVAKVLDHHITDRTTHLDFIARWAERGFETHAGSLIGTMAYMSPEQWTGQEIDQQTDVWAVGVVLWEILTGRHPLAPLTTAKLETVSRLDVPMPSIYDVLPEVGPLGAVVDRCLAKHKAQRIASSQALLEAIEPLLPVRGASPAIEGEPENPYVGLAAFQHTDAARFFGRDRDIVNLMAMLRNHRMVTVAGPSGAGKSSFVRAGVIPALERSGQTWEAFIIRPGRRPLDALAEVLAQVSRAISETPDGMPDVESHDAVIDSLHNQPGYLGAVLRARCHKRNGHVLLFVDQFEELYTLGADRDTREAFVRCLESVADDASSPLRVLLSVRSDFLDRVAEDRAFTSELMRGLTMLSPLSRDHLRQALIEPLAAVEYRFESEPMIEGILDTLQATRSPLPLLQFTAARLWELRDRDHRYISEQCYEAIGGIEGALATHADAVLAGLSRDEQRLARAVFTSLVSDERTRAIVSLDELRASVDDAAADTLERVVGHLSEARLVIIATDSEAGKTVELTHESLIDRWPKLAHWLDEEQEAIHFRSRVRVAAKQWDKQGRTDDLLWRGQAAHDVARQWRRGASALGDLGARDRAFIQAAVALAMRAQRRRRRVFAVIGALISVMMAVVVILAVRAERLAVRAERDAIHARNAGRMASAREHQTDPTLALALVREIEPAQSLPPRWRDLARWAMHQGVSRAVLPHRDIVFSAAFSRDGTRVVTASRDRLARVWNADGSGQPIVLTGHQGAVNSAAFSPDGARVVTVSHDRTVRLWNADGSGQPIVLTGHRGIIRSAAFSPDGARIVTASHDRTVRIWNADGSGEPIVLTGHHGRVYSASFSPDGARIVTGSGDQIARVWNADGAGQPIRLIGHQGSIYAASFSPDGTRILTASHDQAARVWNAERPRRPIRLIGHKKAIYAAAFSPDSTRVATVSHDKTARVWNADGSEKPISLIGHRGPVQSVMFSRDGRRVVTASADRTARVWDVDGAGQVAGVMRHPAMVQSASFSPDGARVVTACADKIARVWSGDFSRKPILLTGHRNIVFTAMFSPDGARIVTASADRTARVWNADGSGQPIVLAGHQDLVYSAAFSPDGTRIVTASYDKTVRVWNADGSGQPVVFTGHDGLLTAGTPGGGGAFSPDGSRVVTISDDKTMQVWNADGSGEPVVLRIPEIDAYSAAFSPDGTRIVTTSHQALNPDTGEIEHWATIWPIFGRFTDLDDPALWRATSYCPPVDLRTDLLGVSEARAAEQVRSCRARVAAARP